MDKLVDLIEEHKETMRDQDYKEMLEWISENRPVKCYCECECDRCDRDYNETDGESDSEDGDDSDRYALGWYELQSNTDEGVSITMTSMTNTGMQAQDYPMYVENEYNNGITTREIIPLGTAKKIEEIKTIEEDLTDYLPDFKRGFLNQI